MRFCLTALVPELGDSPGFRQELSKFAVMTKRCSSQTVRPVLGLMEALSIRSFSQRPRMSVLLATVLIASTPVPDTETRTMDVEFADLTGDGQLELIRAVEGGTNHILVQTGDGWEASRNLRFSDDGSDSEDVACCRF